MRFQPWHVIAATVTAGAVVLSGMGYLAFDTVRSAQVEAISAIDSAIMSGIKDIELTQSRMADLELALSNAQQIFDSSAGKTLDDAARNKLTAELRDGQEILREEERELTELEDAVEELKSVDTDGFFWPGEIQNHSDAFSEIASTSVDEIIIQVQDIGLVIKAVQEAETAWQAEQDRIAAEKAAAEAAAAAQAAAARAAARNAATQSSLSESGGGTAPSAPAPPATPPPPAQVGFNIEAYVLALAPNSFISWVPDLCVQYYVCGRAWVGGTNSTPVRIELDPNKREIYGNEIGISVLVHEAAHARQWWTYGANILDESLAQAPQFAAPPGSTEAEMWNSGKRAVEYMADCATIGKLGYSTGAYTSSCTSDQISRIAGIW